MCTVIVSFEPDAEIPVLLIGARDEFFNRPWIPPGRHWPRYSGLVGGQDLLAGGTWLAVRPVPPRVACVLNGQGETAAAQGRRSRGELPLIAASGETLTTAVGYDPFHLITADPIWLGLLSWDGVTLRNRTLHRGLHIIVNSGLEGELDFPHERARADMLSRIAHFRPRLLAAQRPTPRADGTDAQTAWGDWFTLANGDSLDTADERAMILRRDLGDGELWGTSSVSLVALGRDEVRYDFLDKTG